MPEKIAQLQRHYGLKEIIFVGDRGIITKAVADKIKGTKGLYTISALTHRQMVELLERKTITAFRFVAIRISSGSTTSWLVTWRANTLSSWRYDGLRSFRLPFSALTVSARVAGAREALLAAGLEPPRNFYGIGDPRDAAFVQGLTAGRKIGAIICANDFTASSVDASFGCSFSMSPRGKDASNAGVPPDPTKRREKSFGWDNGINPGYAIAHADILGWRGARNSTQEIG